jgi:hypothetical protein
MRQLVRPSILVLTVLALGIKVSPRTSAVGGDCLYDCETSLCYDYSNHSDYCGNLRAQCLAKCSAPNGKKAPSPPPAAPRKISWGAIAYSIKDMGAGYSQGKDDQASAEKEAMAVCSQRGKACVLRAAFNKQCGAFAVDREFSGVGTSADQREAQQKAVDECKKAGGARCVLHISFCSM